MILVFAHEASLTGAPKSLLSTCERLNKQYGYQFFFVFDKGGELISHFEQLGQCLVWNTTLKQNIFARAVNNIFFPNRKKKLYLKIARNHRIQFIYFNTIAHPEYLLTLAHELNSPIITHVRELSTVIRYYSKRFPVLNLLKYSNYIISVSESVRHALTSEFDIDQNKISVIHNGIDANIQSESEYNKSNLLKSIDISQDQFIVSGCGNQLFRKGVDLFIQTANYIINELNINNISFIWIGGDLNSLYSIEIQNEIKKFELNEFVKLIPATNQVDNYLRLSDIYYITSREEPFGKVLLESAMIPIPVIGFRNSGFPEEYIEHEVNGLLADYSCIQQAGDYIVELSKNIEKRAFLSKNNESKVKNYSLNNTAEAIHKVFCKFS